MAGREKSNGKNQGIIKDTQTGITSKDLRSKSVKNLSEMKKELGQTTLDGVVKKVTFEESSLNEWKDFKTKVYEDMKKIKQNIIDMEKSVIEVKEKNMEILDKLEKMEKKFDEFEEKDRDRVGCCSGQHGASGQADQFEEVGRDGVGGSQSSINSIVSSRSIRSEKSAFSAVSGASLTEREFWQIKRLLNDKDRKDRLERIVIKGVNIKEIDDENVARWVEKFIAMKLGTKVSVLSANIRGRVILVKLGSLVEKKEIMRSKNKLAGTSIFIEHDISFDDRKKQEEIIKWAKEKKNNGLNVKIGLGRIGINNTWVKWEDKEALKNIESCADKSKDNRLDTNKGKGQNNERSENLTNFG